MLCDEFKRLKYRNYGITLFNFLVHSLSKYTNPTYLLLAIFGLSSLILQVASGREFVDESLRMYGWIFEPTEGFTNLSRILNIFVVIVLASIVFIRGYSVTAIKMDLVYGLSVYFISNIALGSIFGTFTGVMDIYSIVSYFVLIIILISSDLDMRQVLLVCRHLLALMVLSSLLSALIADDWAYVSDFYVGYGGESRRLLGFFNHPRVLGLYSLFLLIIELLNTKENSSLKLIYIIGSVFALYLSMSKTAIVLLFVVLVFWFLSVKKDDKYGSSHAWILLFGAFLTACCFVFYFVFLDFYDNNQESLTSLTGRSDIWGVTYSNFLNNPIFGNGPAFFGSSGPVGIAHAHNLFLQALSDGGVIGFFGLLIFLYKLISMAFVRLAVGEYFPLCSVVVLFVFSMTEPIIRFSGIYSGEFFVFSFVLLSLTTDRSALNKNI